jgi:hypothetical protein
MIRISDCEEGIHWLSTGDEMQFYLIDGDAERLNGPAGVIGWVSVENGERVFHPMGGGLEGEGAPLSTSALVEILHIMQMSVPELQALAERDAVLV